MTESDLLGGRCAYFIFFLLGGGEGGVRCVRRGAASIFIEKCQEGGVRGRAAGRVSAGFFQGGGAAKSFFRGRNSHQI